MFENRYHLDEPHDQKRQNKDNCNDQRNAPDWIPNERIQMEAGKPSGQQFNDKHMDQINPKACSRHLSDEIISAR